MSKIHKVLEAVFVLDMKECAAFVWTKMGGELWVEGRAEKIMDAEE